MSIVTRILFLALAISPAPEATAQDGSAITVLRKLSDRLSHFETISYKYHRSVNYFSENYHHEMSGVTFLDFRNTNNVLGFRFQFENSLSKTVYNGTESFYLDKKAHTTEVHHKPQQNDFSSLSFFVNSMVTLRASLPALIADPEVSKTLRDTTIDNKRYYLVSFALRNKTLSGTGGFDSVTIPRDFLYQVVVAPSSFLPLHIIQTSSAAPKDYVLTSFTDFKSRPAIPLAHSWFASTYSKDYKPVSAKKPDLVKQDTKAPDWQRAFVENAEPLQLSSLKGNVVLLEFWIRNCGYCVAAVPRLNTLIEAYKGKRLQVIGINPNDSKEDISFFYGKNQPKFRAVSDSDRAVTAAYGVDAFPTVVLIDKAGIVLYAGDFDQKLLDGLIKTALK
jgi:peroxiredoxin/outer membrane lipoprotein-sorting protein